MRHILKTLIYLQIMLKTLSKIFPIFDHLYIYQILEYRTYDFLKWFFKTPFYTTGAIAMNIFIRAFPYRKAVHTDGTWDLTHSSKETIVSEQSQD